MGRVCAGGEIRGWGENVRWMQDFRFEQEEDMAAPSGDEALTSAGRRKLREQRADPGLVFTVFDKVAPARETPLGSQPRLPLHDSLWRRLPIASHLVTLCNPSCTR